MTMVYRNIRFSEKVDRCLRRRWRMHGDLSSLVRMALERIDLGTVKLVEVDNNRARATQIGNVEPGWNSVQSIARERRCSVNTLVNSAVWAAFGGRRTVLSGFVRGPDNTSIVTESCFSEA